MVRGCGEFDLGFVEGGDRGFRCWELVVEDFDCFVGIGLVVEG